jgi:hypothetical protein
MVRCPHIAAPPLVPRMPCCDVSSEARCSCLLQCKFAVAAHLCWYRFCLLRIDGPPPVSRMNYAVLSVLQLQSATSRLCGTLWLPLVAPMKVPTGRIRFAVPLAIHS